MKTAIKKSFIVKFAAVLFLPVMIVSLTGCSGHDSVTKDQNGNYTAEGEGICAVEEQDISYLVHLRVRADSDGKILSIEDAGTKIPDDKNGLFITAQELFDVLVGKDLSSLSEVDVISGATCSSKAILEAVEDALQSIADLQNK